mmetsp:Transcript_13807/g.34012  ORF Transcript_13807/g.34012 Transcript_13807/m.34012 type:complete len:425 (-) Transcript_13807:441-1715(-)|eukprot:CAMPEP_0178991780 /NCGR_PEP_ID=MMETSP0795-20121207/5731_1 /TAXON_ID=88552 /ORGANISM="Amoebophrya sp., Strain Ameob2" /LENGTH=424 /DNA_ID=CAMNT_0020683553 /DNA_START=103 /DNA_END=1377 /DNA_ORIENTATION=+
MTAILHSAPDDDYGSRKHQPSAKALHADHSSTSSPSSDQPPAKNWMKDDKDFRQRHHFLDPFGARSIFLHAFIFLSQCSLLVMELVHQNRGGGANSGPHLDSRLTLSYIFTSFEHTALLGELLFLVGAYTIWNSVSNAWWASYFKSKHYWPNLADRKGFICSSHQAELVLGSTLAPHHLFAGALHIYGHYFFPPSSAPQLLFIRHGILWEAAFNLHDYVSLFFRLFPHNDPAHRSHVLPLVAHHFGALAFGSFVILRADVLGREDLQRICIALEAAAGMNLGLLAYGYTCCFKRDVVPLWLSSILSASLFMYYRFYEFPVNAYSLVRFLLENTESVLVLEGASGAGEGSFHPVFTSGAVLSVLGFTIFNFHTVWMSTRRSLKMTEILLTEKFADRAWGQAALKLTRTMKKILFGGAKNADKKQQ